MGRRRRVPIDHRLKPSKLPLQSLAIFWLKRGLEKPEARPVIGVRDLLRFEALFPGLVSGSRPRKISRDRLYWDYRVDVVESGEVVREVEFLVLELGNLLLVGDVGYGRRRDLGLKGEKGN